MFHWCKNTGLNHDSVHRSHYSQLHTFLSHNVVYNCLVYIRVHIRLDTPHPRRYTATYLYNVHNQSDNHHRTSCVYIAFYINPRNTQSYIPLCMFRLYADIGLHHDNDHIVPCIDHHTILCRRLFCTYLL